jgi:hypothetical protein
MNSEDYRSLLELVQHQLREIGESEIADDDRYVAREVDAKTALRPEDLLVEMLASFERILAVQDQQTFIAALKRLNGSISGPAISGAEVISPIPGSLTEATSLAETPDLRSLRLDIRRLLGELRESRDGGWQS